MLTALKLNSLEACQRQALWSKDWEAQAVPSTEFLRRGIYEGLTTLRGDFGEAAGEKIMDLGGERGLAIDLQSHVSIYDQVLHHAALADLISTHLRQDEPWEHPEPVGEWEPLCFRDGAGGLRRLILTGWWNQERALAETHSWLTLGEMAMLELPMQLDVIILGGYRKGRRHSAWCQGHLHPMNHKLRFKRSAHYGSRDKPFAESWELVNREDRDEISREQWLAAMENDQMFEELHLQIPVSLPSSSKIRQLREIIKTKAGTLTNLETSTRKGLPEPSYSSCFDPIHPCSFQECCLGASESEPSEDRGFVRLQEIQT